MNSNLNLEEMSKEDKLQIMEDIWNDLTQNPKDFESPAWHLDVLKAREKQIKSGESKFINWEDAKKVLRNRHS